MDPVRHDLEPAAPSELAWRAHPKFQDRVWRHVLLFALTILTTTLAGGSHYVSFVAEFGAERQSAGVLSFLLSGLWYSGTVLAILGCHEMGHYLACRYYAVDASLPFFLPLPPPFPTGTLGAFIRIREPIPSKRTLFDIGIAGPIAGFLVTVPTLFVGLAMSNVVRLPPDFVSGYWLGEPLLFKAAIKLLFGTPPDGYSVNLHPMAFGAWFGLIATALNLIPIGQLDGGHISYAVLGRRSSHVTLAMVLAAIGLAYFSTSWIVWTTLMIGMLLLFGRHHPRTFDENEPLDNERMWLALVALIILIVCFTPAPIEPLMETMDR